MEWGHEERGLTCSSRAWKTRASRSSCSSRSEATSWRVLAAVVAMVSAAASRGTAICVDKDV